MIALTIFDLRHSIIKLVFNGCAIFERYGANFRKAGNLGEDDVKFTNIFSSV